MNKNTYTRIDDEINAILKKADAEISELESQIETLYGRKDACDAEMKKATETGEEQTYKESFATHKYLVDRISVLEKKREDLEQHALITVPQWNEYHADILREYLSNRQAHLLAMKEAWSTFWKHAREMQSDCNRVNYLLNYIHDDILRDDFDGWRNTVPEPSKNQRTFKKASCENWNQLYADLHEIVGLTAAITSVMSIDDDKQIVD